MRVEEHTGSKPATPLGKLVRKIRDSLVATRDTVCLDRARLVTEAYRAHEGEPVPLKRAHAFRHVLEHMQLDVHTNPVFAGNTSSRPRAWMLVPEHGYGNDTQVVIENDCLKGHLDGKIPDGILDFWKDRSFGGSAGIGHLAVDLDRVVKVGLQQMVEEAEAHASDGDEAQRNYRQAMVICLNAVVHWAERYAAAAASAAREAGSPVVREAHLRVARACEHVPAQPARDLFEGLQAIVLVHLAIAIEGHGMSVSVGLPDRALAAFIGPDFDLQDGTDLVSATMLKIAANSLFGRGSKTQAITVGGADHTGRDCCNSITRCFLDACDAVRVGDPHLFLRWHSGMDAEVMERALEMLAAGVSMPLLINDGPTANGFVNAGVSEPDAWDYCVIGCNELGIPGRSAESATARAGTIQYIGLLNETLLEHPDPDAIEGMDALMSALEALMGQRAREMRERSVKHRPRVIADVPTPFTSALMRGTVPRGRDLLEGMEYHLPGVYERGLTNATNALAAIEKTVFQDGTSTLRGIVAACREDWKDNVLRARVLECPKWGNDDGRADRWALALVAMRERVLDEVDAAFGQRSHMMCHVVRSLHHVDGRRIAASPDGRRAWTPVADSIGAETGTANQGPTGILNSVLKLDAASNYRGGYNLNLTFSDTDASPDRLRSVVETFFGEGGQEVQINCFSAETLRAAREDPGSYGDLVVRVAGFSTRFVDLAVAEQDELIERAERAGNGSRQ